MEDWRLQGQETYLKEKTLTFSTYKVIDEDWDHDHCEFCFAKFSKNIEGALKEGYKTQDERWICTECFNDFHKHFKWKVKLKQEVSLEPTPKKEERKVKKANDDFDKIAVDEIREGEREGTRLSKDKDGNEINVRKDSSDTRATLERQKGKLKEKIRYGKRK